VPAKELARLGRAAGARAGRLAEHEVRGRLLLVELRDRRDDVLVAVEDQQVVDGADLHWVAVPGQVAHPEHRAAVLRVGLLEEVHLAVRTLVHVLQVRARLDDGAVDVGLEVGVQAERFREAPVLGPVRVAAGHERDEVVLHRQGFVLRREGGRRLPGPRQADDHEHLLAGIGGDDLQPRVEGQPTEVEDLLVPHPQTALLRLPEVVGVQDARDPVVQVDGDDAVIGVAGRREVRRVDHVDLGLVAVLPREVELLLHAGDVRVRLLDREAGLRAEGRVVADVAVDDDDLLVAEVLVLHLRDLLELLTGHRLAR
jgi:hypothetical protein